jgi:CheY-like chemotaxis protein
MTGAGPGQGAPRRRVLVVDDESDIREVVAGILVEEGYEVAVATGGADALRLVGGWPPDVILLDLWMPDFDGAAFVAAYRQLPGRHAPIIAFTALPDGAEQAERIAAEVLLPKPFHIHDLLRLVSRYAAYAGDRLA